eukprot:768520-Hanusia_phi.AAC.4
MELAAAAGVRGLKTQSACTRRRSDVPSLLSHRTPGHQKVLSGCWFEDRVDGLQTAIEPLHTPPDVANETTTLFSELVKTTLSHSIPWPVSHQPADSLRHVPL